MNIKALRESIGLSQMELASKLGVTIRTVQNWEYGAAIPASRLHKIEDFFASQGQASGAPKPNPAPVPSEPTSGNTLDRILDEMVGMRKVVEDQLSVKDTQINKLLDLLEKRAE